MTLRTSEVSAILPRTAAQPWRVLPFPGDGLPGGYICRVPVGFGVSLLVRGVTTDPTPMLASAAGVIEANRIDVLRVGDVVRFTAEQVDALSVLAGPLAAWWQEHGPTTADNVALRFVGPHGVRELCFSQPDLAADLIAATIKADSGTPYGPGEAPGPLRRRAATLLRKARPGFTASQVSIQEQNGVLSVTLAGRQLDDQPRSVEFQVFNPAHEDHDPDDDGYCLVNEDHVPIYRGLVALQLTPRHLRLQLTLEAARAWGSPSATYPIRLRLPPDQVRQLRDGLRRLFTYDEACQPAPRLDLG
jgi:hypothetical protein